jgi:Protein of unknown function (DUF455)
MGYDVDVNATRFSNYLHVLRELVHLTAGHLALEPRFDVKALLGDHLHDDARAVSKLHRRLYELRTPSDYPGAPSPELAAVLDRAAGAGTHEYLELAYGELKPTLIGAFRIHLANLDPLIDEPSLRLLTQLLHRQERHVAELPAGREHIAFEDLGALPLRLRETRPLKVMPPLDRPQRDAFVEVADEGALDVNGHVPAEPEEQNRFFHGLMNAELCAAELVARSSHEHPDMPWDFHVDMARRCWDGIRHAEIHDRLMATELGCHWGDHPVGFSSFRSIYAFDLLGRLALLDGDGEQMAVWGEELVELGQEPIARVFDYLLADEVPHVHNGMRWGTHLLGGDEQAYREKVRALRAELDRTGTTG